MRSENKRRRTNHSTKTHERRPELHVRGNSEQDHRKTVQKPQKDNQRRLNSADHLRLKRQNRKIARNKHSEGDNHGRRQTGENRQRLEPFH